MKEREFSLPGACETMDTRSRSAVFRQMRLGIALVLLSVILYAVHYAVFHDLRHIFIYTLGDVAFLPVDVLIVTLIIHRALLNEEKRAMREKLNMVIGAFFNETGYQLLERLSRMDANLESIRKRFLLRPEWTSRQYAAARAALNSHRVAITVASGTLSDLKAFLGQHQDFLLRLLENPVLLEHQEFTDLLWAVFHLQDELAHRRDVSQLPQSDLVHLSGDMERAYSRLLLEWLSYMRHLQVHYPYLFSLALRSNFFDPQARPEVRESAAPAPDSP